MSVPGPSGIIGSLQEALNGVLGELSSTVGRGYSAVGRTMRSWLLNEYFPIAVVIVVSTILNFLLVFQHSEYWNYLTSDMHGYWERAMQIFNGDEKDPNTWVSNAPFYPRVIAAIFTWLNYFHLNSYFLETMLSLNILLSGLGTLGLYLIGLQITKHKKASLILAASYAFSYPNLYFNAFLLGEPFAVPIIIFSIWLMYHYRNDNKIFIAGLVLAFAVGVRPSNGLLGLPFALYVVFAGFSFRGKSKKELVKVLMPRVVRGAIFSLAFFFVIFGMMAENYRISDGELRGMTAHAGYNFFLGQTQSHQIISSYDGITYIFVPSSVAGHPEYGTVTTHIPIYKSDEYFREGWKVLKANPELWLDHFKQYKFLFFDNLFPSTSSVLGFDQFFDPFRYITFYMLVFLGLLYIAFKEKDIDNSHIFFFGSIFILCSATLYFFTITHQYFLNFSYSLYVLFFIAAFSVFRYFEKYKKFIIGYVLAVIVLTGCYYANKEFSKVFVDKKIQVTIEQNQGPIYNFDTPKNIVSSKDLDVNTLQFFESEELEHGTLGKLGYRENFFLSAKTEFEVLEGGQYMFTFYADDGYRVLLDGKYLMGYDGLKKMNEFQIRETTHLEKGRHVLDVDLFQNGVLSGLVGLYRRIDPDNPPTTPYEYYTKRGQGNLIGEDDAYTKFFYPTDG